MPNDDGTRTVNLTLRLTGLHRNVLLKLGVGAKGLSSKPVLIDSVIRIDNLAFPGKGIHPKKHLPKEVVYPVLIKLASLTCLQNDETFTITGTIGNRPADSLVIKILHFTDIPDEPTITLKEDSSIVVPVTKKATDDGLRTIIVRVALAGRKRPVKDGIIQFVIPPYIRSRSTPVIQNGLNFVLPAAAFPKEGCPDTLKIPLIIQLQENPVAVEERIPVLLAGDDAHAHVLILRPEVKPAVEPKEDSSKKEMRFTHACQRRNYTITLKPDSLGGVIDVKADSAKKTFRYQYNNFFHTGDFAQWFFNSLKPSASGACNDCATCVSYIAERIYEELLVAKKSGTGNNSTATDAKTIVGAKVDTASKETDKKKDTTAAAAAQTKAPAADTVSDTIPYSSNISYSDSNAYSLQINRMKSKTDLILCKDPKKGQDSCNTTSVPGDLNKESFTNAVTALLQKFKGAEIVDVNKISPVLAQQFSDYAKALAAKKPKEKTEAEKQAIALFAADTLTETKVGVMYLKDSLVGIYNADGQLLKKTKIDSVMFTIESGKLSRRQLIIETVDGSFTNKRAPISTLIFDERGLDRLWNEEKGNNTFIYLKDVLKYRYYSPYFPDDLENATVSPKNPAKVLSAASNLNSLINVAIYTDLPGLLGRKANGLINTDVTSRFMTNAKNISNWDVTLAAFIEANLCLSKFDSKFKSLDSTDIRVNSGTHADTLNRLKIIQTAWLKGSIKLNVVSIKLLAAQYIEVNFGTRVNVVNADSIYRKSSDIISFDYYPELVYSVKRLSNFGMDLSIRWISQRLSGKAAFANGNGLYVFNPEAAFYYYPVNKSSSRMYLRFDYFAGHDKLFPNFYQLQFGYKTSLNLSK